MSNVARRRMKVSLCRAMIVGAVSLVLIAVSFHGGVDEFAQEQVAETTNESIAIYVVSRAINALVSMLQTSQANVLLVSVQVGQMLDPVNDAVERLSSIVVWAVGSLFVQRILLEVAASPVFKWILCSIGVVTIAALWLAEWGRVRMWCCQVFGVSDRGLERGRDWLVRIFVVAAIFRFIIPVFIGISFLVSQMFLATEIAKSREQLSVLRTQVSNVASSTSPDSGSLKKERTDEKARIQGQEESKASARQEMERLDTRIGQLTDEVGWRRVLPEILGGVSPGDELRTAKERRREVDRKIERIEDAIGESEEALECIDRRIAGESCDSLLDRVSEMGKASMSQVRKMFGELNEMTTDITMLLIAIAIKSILFPIVFLMGAVRCSLPIARHSSRMLCGFERDARKLKDTVTGHLQGRGSQLERSES